MPASWKRFFGIEADDLRVNAGLTRPNQKYIQIASGGCKVGAAAGWTIAAAANTALVTCAASQTAATLVVPIRVPLKAGWKITGFGVIAQIESAGGTVTLDADLRKQTNVAADVSDASVGAITQVSVTADTASVAEKKGLAEVVAVGETFYILITATTAASTDIALQGITITVDEV